MKTERGSKALSPIFIGRWTQDSVFAESRHVTRSKAIGVEYSLT
jgi:hypothetical protein